MEKTEDELEKFRQEWKQEVSAKKKPTHQSSSSSSQAQASGSSSENRRSQRPVAKARIRQDGEDELAPQSYHDLEEKESGRMLGDEAYGVKQKTEPKTALEHYERAVEKEGEGNLGDSVRLYSKAFKLDDRVHEKYKNKHFPPKKPTTTAAASDTSKPGTQPSAQASAPAPAPALPPSLAELISDFSQLSILGEPAPTDMSPEPPCPIAKMPDEILVEILRATALGDIATLSKLSQVCKRLAFLVMTEDHIWKQIVHDHKHGLPAMHYRYACSVTGGELPIEEAEDEEVIESGHVLDPSPIVKPQSLTLAVDSTYPNYRAMFRTRPRIRFNGCYISTVNYTRPGGNASSSITWLSPVLIVTYYRYLRFFPDGSLISLLTTAGPVDVVPYLHKEYLVQKVDKNSGSNLPQAVMKDALRGRWRLSGDPFGVKKPIRVGEGIEAEETESEPEGEIHIETDGVPNRYVFKMHLSFATAGKGAKNNKLNWKGYWSYNRLTDDWAEFGLKNDRPFYWSRVRSYGEKLVLNPQT